MCMWAPVPAAAEITSSAPSSELCGSSLEMNRVCVNVGTPRRCASPASRKYSARPLSGA
jgi:hypothetical protein